MLSKKQLYVLTGGYGSGKSTGAITCARPSESELVYAFDGEGSMNRIYSALTGRNLKLGRYIDMRDRFPDIDHKDILSLINEGQLPWVVDKRKGQALADYWDFMLSDIDENLTPGRYKYLIVDPLSPMESGMAAKVEMNKRDFGVSSTAYGGLWVHGVYPLYEQFLNAVWGRGVDTIIFTSHLKTPWEGSRQVTGKYTMSGKKILYRLSTFMGWLKRIQGQKAPACMVLKDRFIGLDVDTDEDEWIIERRLPERIPEFTWRNVRKYLSGEWKIGERDGETLSQNERDMISPMLKDKQLDLMIAEAEHETAQAQLEYQRALLAMPLPPTPSPITLGQKTEAARSLSQRITTLRTEHGDDEIESILLSEGNTLPMVLRAFNELGGKKEGEE